MAQYHKDSDTTIQKITAAYDNAIKDINSDIEDIVNNYKLSGDLSDKEVKRLLNTKIPNPIRKLMQRILPRIESENIRKYLISRLNAEPYKTRITRLEALKQSCYINSKIIADVELRESTKLYTNTIKKAYYTNLFNIQKGLGIGFNVAKMPAETIQEILKNNWSGSHYSERIWHNTDVLANKLEEIITTGLMTGKSSRRMADELQDMTDCGKFAAERLIRTETTYISNMADMEAYEECDVDKYVFVATLDLRTSNVCREHDGKVYEVKKAIAGDNLPPLHPHCRSTTIAYFGEETLSNMERRARDPETGDTYKVPADMNYEEWYDKYVGASIDKLNRRNSNIDAFKELEEPMQLKHVRKICKEAGIDLTGIKVKIQRDKTLINLPYLASADPGQIGRIDLFPMAFQNREELLRTIVHEKVHVEQYKKYGGRYVMENRGKFEDEAYKKEEEWYNNYIKGKKR